MKRRSSFARIQLGLGMVNLLDWSWPQRWPMILTIAWCYSMLVSTAHGPIMPTIRWGQITMPRHNSNVTNVDTVGHRCEHAVHSISRDPIKAASFFSNSMHNNVNTVMQQSIHCGISVSTRMCSDEVTRSASRWNLSRDEKLSLDDVQTFLSSFLWIGSLGYHARWHQTCTTFLSTERANACSTQSWSMRSLPAWIVLPITSVLCTKHCFIFWCKRYSFFFNMIRVWIFVVVALLFSTWL